MNPIPQGDDSAMFSDGSIAIVRGRDYHVDWVGAQGITSSPKIPYEWRGYADEQKVAFIDSAKVAIEKARASGQFNGRDSEEARCAQRSRMAPVADQPRDSATRGGARRNGLRARQLRQPRRWPRRVPPLTLVAPNELPDYRAAFTRDQPAPTSTEISGSEPATTSTEGPSTTSSTERGSSSTAFSCLSIAS